MLLVLKPKLINSICFTVGAYVKVCKSKFVFRERDCLRLLHWKERAVLGNSLSVTPNSPESRTGTADPNEGLRLGLTEPPAQASQNSALTDFLLWQRLRQASCLPAQGETQWPWHLDYFTRWFRLSLSLLSGSLNCSGCSQLLSPHVSWLFCIFLIRAHSSQHAVVVVTWLSPSLDCVLFTLVKTF